MKVTMWWQYHFVLAHSCTNNTVSAERRNINIEKEFERFHVFWKQTIFPPDFTRGKLINESNQWSNIKPKPWLTWKQYKTAHRKLKGCLSFIIDMRRTTMAELKRKTYMHHWIRSPGFSVNIVWLNSSIKLMPQIAQTDTKSIEFSSLCLKICFNQSEGLPRSGQWHVISMEFLRSFLRGHLREKLW